MATVIVLTVVCLNKLYCLFSLFATSTNKLLSSVASDGLPSIAWRKGSLFCFSHPDIRKMPKGLKVLASPPTPSPPLSLRYWSQKGPIFTPDA